MSALGASDIIEAGGSRVNDPVLKNDGCGTGALPSSLQSPRRREGAPAPAPLGRQICDRRHQPADELDEVRTSCAGLQGTVLSVRLQRMDRKEMNDIRSRVQGREVDREIAFYCECPDPNCRAAVALPASALADLRRQGIPVLFPAH